MTARGGPKIPKLKVDIAALGDGYGIRVNGNPLKTPGKRPFVVNGAALAQEIRGEIAQLHGDDPTALAGKGLSDPGQAANFRIAAGAIDVIAGEGGARAQIIADLAAYGETDLICFRAERPEELVAAEEALWTPLVNWIADELGVEINVTTGLRAVPQDDAALVALAAAIEKHDDFALAALSLATRTAGSIVIGLALSRGRLDAETAFAASAVDENFQAARWGADEDAAKALGGKGIDIAQAARFFDLLTKG